VDLVEFTESLHRASANELVNLTTDGRTKALEVPDILASRDVLLQFTELVSGVPVRLGFELTILEVTELEKAIRQLSVWSLGLGEEIVNLGGDGLADTLEVHDTLTRFNLVVESAKDFCTPVVGGSLVKVGSHLSEFEETFNETLVHTRLLGDSSSRVVQGVELVERSDLLFVGFIEELLELLNLGARLGVELLELEDVIGDRSNVHVGSRFDENLMRRGSLRCLKIRFPKNIEMLALAKPNYVPVRLQTKKVTHRRPVRAVRVQAALPDPDLANYAAFQLASWVMPMTIAGRLLKMEYPEIATGLVILGVAKTALAAGGIIHY